jgi:pimeloyl-ACP methyl ester carboxylesterase
LLAYRAMMRAARAEGAPLCRHFIVEAPSARGAYYGSMAFSDRVWARLSPLVSREHGPFVLVGLSRGAFAALDAAIRITEERSKVAAVLALSPPLAVPERLASSIVDVAAFERAVDAIERCTGRAPAFATRLAERWVRWVYVLITAVIHEELRMGGDEDFRLAVHDVDAGGPLAIGARGVREFRLVVEAPDADLEHFVNRLCACAARTERIFTCCAWGDDDPWSPTLSCKARLEQAREREGAPADRVVTHMLAGRGHALFRERAQPVLPLAERFALVTREALRRAQDDRERKQRDRALEHALRESAYPEKAP